MKCFSEFGNPIVINTNVLSCSRADTAQDQLMAAHSPKRGKNCNKQVELQTLQASAIGKLWLATRALYYLLYQ